MTPVQWVNAVGGEDVSATCSVNSIKDIFYPLAIQAHNVLDLVY